MTISRRHVLPMERRSSMAKKRSNKPATTDGGALPLALVVDAHYLHGIALAVRRHIQTALIPSVLETVTAAAEHGEMECFFVPDIRNLTVEVCCEALEPELERRGFETKIARHEFQRLGMKEVKTVLAVGWRTPR